MSINKISPELLHTVNILSTQKQHCLVSTENFNDLKHFLIKNQFEFVPYRFANCFFVFADKDDLVMLANQKIVDYIHANTKVLTYSQEKNIINLDKFTENKYLGQGQTICYIDTGIYPHIDFCLPRNRIIKFIDFTTGRNIPYDDNGHGSFVAGIGSGAGILNKHNIGIAPRSNIISLKALASNGASNSNMILDAMQWVYENHKVYNISVVCMSFGADVINNIDPLSKGAESLWKRGIIIVAAAGNSGPKSDTIKSPGNNKHIITVGALDMDLHVPDFSSRGPTIYGHKPDLVAPGVNITNCNNNTPPYLEMSGTSVATPIIAGICADIKSKWPNMTNDEVKQFLLKHCTKITGDIDSEGAGYINFKDYVDNDSEK